jgi:hypothetical protein
MKVISRVVLGISLSLALTVPLATTALAAPGGMPAAHGLSGEEFGAAVSELAQSYPGAVADHVSGRDGMSMAGGMPAAHGLSGEEFGAAVSELAQSYPGAVADHVSGH